MNEAGLFPADAGSHPVTVDLVAPLEIARWRPLVHWLLAIPHYVVIYVYQLILGVLTVLAFFAIVFTGNIPPSLFAFMVGVYRYEWRVTSYVYGIRKSYPSFGIASGALEPGDDAARLSVLYPERLSRLLSFVKWLAAIPHYIVLLFLWLAAFFVWGVGASAVLVTGRWPGGMRDFLVGVTRWSTRVSTYAGLLTDTYPPFTLAP
jgi:Domain of unknown function (DUF4389)